MNDRPNDIKALEGVTNIYPSAEAKGFTDAEKYPIAWEVIFINDKIGQEFTANIQKTFSELPKEKGYLLGL